MSLLVIYVVLTVDFISREHSLSTLPLKLEVKAKTLYSYSPPPPPLVDLLILPHVPNTRVIKLAKDLAGNQ